MQFIGIRGSTKVYTNEHKKQNREGSWEMYKIKKKTVAQYSRWYVLKERASREFSS